MSGVRSSCVGSSSVGSPVVAYGIVMSYEDFALRFNGGEMLSDLKEMCGYINDNLTDNDRKFSLIHISDDPDDKEDGELLLCHITELDGFSTVRISKTNTRNLLDSMGLDSDDYDYETYLVDLNSAKMCYIK